MSVRAHRRPEAPETEPRTAPAPTTDAPASDEVHALFDTPSHIRIGDQVGGEPVVIHGLVFTPGEIAALVDFVGPPSVLFSFDEATLCRIREHLDAGGPDLEDAAFWDSVTPHDPYSERAQDNEDHFAPGAGGGPSFADSFLGLYADALRLMQQAAAVEEQDPDRAALLRNVARASAYGAEHYLEDAYSAGHQVSATDLNARIDPLLEGPDTFEAVATAAGALAYPTCAEALVQWEILNPADLGYSPIDSLGEWMALVGAAAANRGVEGVRDAVRQEVHEQLAAQEVPLMARCDLRAEPFPLGGDHAPSPESEEVLASALTYARDLLEHPTEASPTRVAALVWERTRPRLTDDGAARVDQVVAACTRDRDALASAMAAAIARTLDDVMAAIVAQSHGTVRRRADAPAPEPVPAPDAPETTPEAPVADAPAEVREGSWAGRLPDWAADDRDVPMVASW